MAPRVVVAMSGGVDSSVAAALLQEQDYQVIGVTLRLFPEAPASAASRHPCCLTPEVNDAREVAARLGIPYYVLNFERPFSQAVVDYFFEEYAHGRTPNPCLRCNQVIKFRLLLSKALALGAEYLATGHYARIVQDGGHHLLQGSDPTKDQSYFLYTLGQGELARLLMPVGGLTKARVREMARSLALPVADKEESQDLCFVPGDLGRFLAQHLGTRPGEIVDREGRVLGRHPGIAFFTVGQRHGLGLASPRPLYVTHIDAENHRVVVGLREELDGRELRLHPVSWVSGKPPDSQQVLARLRYRSSLVPARIEGNGEGVRVVFQDPQPRVAPGQAVVFYSGDEVLGGGIVAE